MRLFVDAHVFDDLSQGSKTYLKGIYTAAIKENSLLEFYFAANWPKSIHEELPTAKNVYPIKYLFRNRFARLGFDIPIILKKHKIDWAHFQYTSPLIKVCHEVVTIHDLLFLDYPDFFPTNYKLTKDFLFRRSAKRADKILTVSEYSKQSLSRHYGIRPDQIVVTPNGILDIYWEEKPAYSELASKHGLRSYLLYVSRFEPRKNQVGLLKAYLDLALWKEGIQLVYVGGLGVPSPEFDQLFATQPEIIKKMIFFFQDLQPHDLKWLYSNTLLFVYPSFAEGFGIPPLEALACGANVICSNTTAMSEFKDFLGDRLFDPFEQSDLNERIKFYLNRYRFDNLTSIKQQIKKKYSWESSAHLLLNVFK